MNELMNDNTNDYQSHSAYFVLGKRYYQQPYIILTGWLPISGKALENIQFLNLKKKKKTFASTGPR